MILNIFFSIKIIKQFGGEIKKNFRENKLLKNIIFQNPRGTAAPSPTHMDPPLPLTIDTRQHLYSTKLR
jgi:hypothetical protein